MVSVLCCSGHDPTGGAGIAADLESVAAQGAHALTVITTLTTQNTHNVSEVHPLSAYWLDRQLHVLLNDCPVHAIKIGLMGSVEQLPVFARVIKSCNVPVVMDPIVRAGGGQRLLSQELADQYKDQLFPHCTVLTPNAVEARLLTGCDTLQAAGEALLSMGVQHALITGGDVPGRMVCNHWFSAAGMTVFQRERIEGEFHGAGCTLAAAIAARLALGESVERALAAAQDYVAATLQHARSIGKGRLLPRRLMSETL